MEKFRIWTLYFALVFLGVCIVTLSFSSGVNAAPNSVVWDWERVVVDGTGNDVGMHPSIALKTVQGGVQPFVSYYDATNQQLKLAYYNAPGSGNCNNTAGWSCFVANSTAGTGEYSSLLFLASGVGGVAYTDTSTKYNLIDLLTVNKDLSTSNDVMVNYFYPLLKFPSITLLPSGGLGVAYSSYGYNKDSNTWCGGTEYRDGAIFDTFDSVCQTGAVPPIYVSLASDVKTPSYHAALAYRGQGIDAYSLVNTLNYAHQVTANLGNCYNHSDFQCYLIDSVANTGSYISLHAPQSQNDYARIAYYDGTNHTLKYAKNVGGSAYCGVPGIASSGWSCENIETIGTDNGALGISLAVDSNGNAVIAYHDRDDASNGILKIARYVGSGGNCGMNTAGGKWQCTTVDDGGFFKHTVGQYASLALSPDNRAHIAYYDATGHDLKVATEKVEQHITFNAPASHNQTAFTVSATTTSNLVVTFTASGACTAGGTNGATITPTGLGDCHVLASQLGNEQWYRANPIEHVISITNETATPTLTPTPTVTPQNGCNTKPDKPTVKSPKNGKKLSKAVVTLKWQATNCATTYKVALKQDSKKGKTIFKSPVLNTTQVKTPALAHGHTYFWKLKACNSFGCRGAKPSGFVLP